MLICNLPHQRPGGSRPKAFRRRTANLFHRKPVPLNGAPDRNRTCNPRLRRPMLYPVELRAQPGNYTDATGLSPDQQHPSQHAPKQPSCQILVGAEGFEPTTSSSQSWRSTRLSYTPPNPSACRTGSHAEPTSLRPTQHRVNENRTKTAPIRSRQSGPIAWESRPGRGHPSCPAYRASSLSCHPWTACSSSFPSAGTA